MGRTRAAPRMAVRVAGRMQERPAARNASRFPLPSLRWDVSRLGRKASDDLYIRSRVPRLPFIVLILSSPVPPSHRSGSVFSCQAACLTRPVSNALTAGCIIVSDSVACVPRPCPRNSRPTRQPAANPS